MTSREIIQRGKSENIDSNMIDEETSGFLDDTNENESDSDTEREKTEHVPQLRYSIFQLIGDVVGMFRSLVRISVITTGLLEHFKWSRYSFIVIEILILYTSSAMQLLNGLDRRCSPKTCLLLLFGPLYSTILTIWSHAKCIYYGFKVRSQKPVFHRKLHYEMESMAKSSALYWMTEDAMLLGTSSLFLTLAHQSDWLQFPLPNQFFLTKSINQVCREATGKGITSLNLPEWVLCGVAYFLRFFGEWPMDYLFITRIWILLWSCMWACDFVDFSWSLFVFPSVKGRNFRLGPIPQLHQAANRLMELGYRVFGIILSSSLIIPVIFRSLTTEDLYHDKNIYLHALYSHGFQKYGALETIQNSTISCMKFINPYDDCERYDLVNFTIDREIHDIQNISMTVLRRDTYGEIHQAVDYSIIIYSLLVFLCTLSFHTISEYIRWSTISLRDFHVIIQKSVLFAPFSRYSWRKRNNDPSGRFKSVYITTQILSIPMVIGLLGYCLVDIDYSYEMPKESVEYPWAHIVATTSSYPGGVFNYLSKYFHYYLQTNIFFVTLLPSFIYFVLFACSTLTYQAVLCKIRNYEFLSYRTRYTKFFGEYT